MRKLKIRSLATGVFAALVLMALTAHGVAAQQKQSEAKADVAAIPKSDQPSQSGRTSTDRTDSEINGGAGTSDSISARTAESVNLPGTGISGMFQSPVAREISSSVILEKSFSIGVPSFNSPDASFPQRQSSPGSVTSPSYTFPSAHERARRYARDLFGPFAFIGAGLTALVNHSYNDPDEWGKSGSGFAKRYASAYGASAINETTKYGLSEAFKLDSGFYRSTRTGFTARAGDAIIQSFTSRTRTGKRVLSVPRLAGDFAGAMVPLVWMPKRLGLTDGLRAGGYSILGSIGTNLFQEFILKK
jgi:hypothetical protein